MSSLLVIIIIIIINSVAPSSSNWKSTYRFKQLSNEARAAYAECKQALWKRFEPDSKKELYLAEFQTRHIKTCE